MLSTISIELVQLYFDSFLTIPPTLLLNDSRRETTLTVEKLSNRRALYFFQGAKVECRKVSDKNNALLMVITPKKKVAKCSLDT